MQNSVCMIIKDLYRLRQSGLRWYEKLTAKLQEIGLQPTEQDPCLFFRRQIGRLILVTIYVDDELLIASNHPEWLTEIKTHLSETFMMKNIGPVKTCLGIEFNRICRNIRSSFRR